MSTHYDVLILGSGQSGSPLASAFAAAHKRVALVEASHIGGTCINEGCTPTKTMIASGRVAYLARRAADYGVHTSAPEVDMTRIRQRKRDIVDSFRGGSERRLEGSSAEVVKGTAKFVESAGGEKKVKVAMADGSEEKTLTGDTVFVNTGARPARPKLPGLDGVDPKRVLDSTSVMEVDVVPEHLVVLGGGYIALEFGQLFRRLGAKVTVIQRSAQLLPREDADVASEMQKILTEDGLDILLSSEAKSVTTAESGTITVEVGPKGGGDARTLKGSHLLLAAGRTPNTDTLNVSAAGIKTDNHGFIVVNDRLETNIPGIYALGDVKGGPEFTHISYDDFRIIRSNLLPSPSNPSPPAPKSTSARTPVYVVYTDPQLAHVGLREHEARAKFPQPGKIKVAKMPMAYVARALETDESRGLLKAVVDAETGKILGFTCLGLEGGEVMAVVQTAMLGGLGYEGLREAVFAHPSLAEGLNNLWGFLE